MPFHSDLSLDASIQQGDLEVLETTRLTRRHDPLARDRVQVYHPAEDENGQNDVGLPRNYLELGVERLVPVKVEPEEMDEPVQNSVPVFEGRHLQGNEYSSDIRGGGPPSWLSTAALGQPNQSLNDRENAGQGDAEKWCPERKVSAPLSHSTYTHWFPVQSTGMRASGSQYQPEDHVGKANDQFELGINRHQTQKVTELDLTAALRRCPQPPLESPTHSPAAASSSRSEESNLADLGQDLDWEDLRKVCLVVTHPLFPDMLANHVALLRVGTPVDLLPDIEAQILQAPEITEKYRVLRAQITDVSQDEQEDLDQFMARYPALLGSLRGTLQHHIATDVTEAMVACWEIEKAFYSLTGVRPTQGSGLTMSDGEEEDYDSDYGLYDQGMDGQDCGSLGPLVPSASERTLMEKVRKELKEELKQGYKSKIEDVREEILRKRRAGKLPEGTTALLKGWWSAHSKWPYPTEEEKEILIQKTGLELKQVNNWFINQRKRNWHNNPMSPTGQAVEPKAKARKSW